MDWLDWSSRFAVTSTGDSEPLYQRIVEGVSRAVAEGRLLEGERLPTNRELSNMLKVDRSTVSRAYHELARLGLIDSHVGRGTFVKAFPVKQAKIESSLAHAIKSGDNLRWSNLFSRYADGLSTSMAKLPEFAYGDDVISFAGGIPAQDSYPEAQFKNIVMELLAAGQETLFDYSPFAGEPALRQAVISHLVGRGMAVDDKELLILSGSQQGIDLVANLLIDSGDAVLVEEPTYFWAISNFKARQAELIGCPIDGEGIDLAAVGRNIVRHQPKFIYVMPNNQNPTGITMSLARREGLLALARKYQTPILEDDFCGDLCYGRDPLPALRTLPGGKDIVIYQGTFSKALCPGVRLGWLIAPAEVIGKLSFAKRTSDLATNSMAQVMLTEFLKRGLYQDHLARVKKLYGHRLDTMIGALKEHFAGRPVSWTEPRGGLFLWLTMPAGTSNRDLLSFAVEQGVIFSPGDLCYVGSGSTSNLRLSFIQNDTPLIEEGIKRLARAFDLYYKTFQSERPQVRRSQHVLI